MEELKDQQCKKLDIMMTHLFKSFRIDIAVRQTEFEGNVKLEYQCLHLDPFKPKLNSHHLLQKLKSF